MKITFMLASTCLILGSLQSITAHANALNEKQSALPNNKPAKPVAKNLLPEADNEIVANERQPSARATKQPSNRLTETPISERRQSFFVFLQILRSAK